MSTDEQFIGLALKLAKKGTGQTNPNPLVGAVIVKGREVLGKGYHKKAGLPHAEIEALNSCKLTPSGATLYVNLEPCAHFGKTPPCVDAIIKSGIKRVVCSNLDPNPKVCGEGIKELKQVGIAVSVGILEDEARHINEAFFTYHKKKRPFIVLKFASSLDGKMSTKSGDSKWITNEKARNYARKLRNQYQAVLVGINTVLRDDPHLGDDLRIILDSTLKIPLNSKVLRDANVIVATTVRANQKKEKILKDLGISLVKFQEKHVPLPKLLKKLYEKEIISVFVEGGQTVIESFLREKLFDKVYAFYAPILLDEAKTMRDATRLKRITFKRFDDNILINGS